MSEITTVPDDLGAGIAEQTGRMWHTIRPASGGPWQLFGSVNGQEGNDPGPFTAVGCGGIDDAPALEIGAAAAGHLWQTVRHPDGTWQAQFADLEALTSSDPGSFVDVDCSLSYQPNVFLQLVGVAGGQLWHTLLDEDVSPGGKWQDLRPIQSQESNHPDPFTRVSCSSAGDAHLHVVGIVGGDLWHTIRSDDGSWQPSFDRIEDGAGTDPGVFTDVGCALGAGGELHVVGIVGGQLWHTIRHPDATWQDLRPVGPQHSNDPGVFTAVDCAAVRDPATDDVAVHVVGVAQAKVWHTIRHSTGAWQGVFGEVTGTTAGDPGDFTDVSCDAVTPDLHVVGLADTGGLAPSVSYGWLPPAQTVHDGAADLTVPAGKIHQSAETQHGGPDIDGVYVEPVSGWRSMVWRWADTMRSDAIQHVSGPGGKPAYRVEVTPQDGPSQGTQGDHPRAELYSVDPSEKRRDIPAAPGSVFRDGDEYWATFAIYLDPNFPANHKWATLFQRKIDDPHAQPSWFSLNVHGTTIDITAPGDGPDQYQDVTTLPDMLGQWTQFVVHERLSSSGDGLAEIYIGDTLKWSESGQRTVRSGDINFHFQYGYYRANEAAAGQPAGPGPGVVYYSPMLVKQGATRGALPLLP